MLLSIRLHKILTRQLYRRTIALVQIMIMVMLAVPACCYELEPDHEKAGIGQSMKTTNADQDECPCCPDENTTDSNADTCSTCSYCSLYAPLIPVISTNYDPAIVPLIAPNQFTKLTDVHIPIFVPPQNLV